MRKILIYTSFIVTSLLVILAFVTATTYLQLGIAIALYPVIAFFAYKFFVVKSDKVPKTEEVPFQSPAVKPAEKTEVDDIPVVKVKKGDVSITDIDKRAFLKLIGGTGISFLLYSLFTRKTGTQFFGGSSGPGISVLTDGSGKKINPSESQPLDGYIISEIDDGYVAYYGFINNTGAWYIMKEDPVDGTFRYIKGQSNFSSNWISRETNNYDYFYNIFK